MPCITCQNSLRDYGKITPDWQWAYCSICGARYEVIANVNEDGYPVEALDGHQKFYLNPVKPGDVRFYKESEDVVKQEPEQAPTDFEKLKDTIRSIDTVTEFMNSLKTL